MGTKGAIGTHLYRRVLDRDREGRRATRGPIPDYKKRDYFIHYLNYVRVICENKLRATRELAAGIFYLPEFPSLSRSYFFNLFLMK
jgi:hypothetical protein